MERVFIVRARRTPIGKFFGSLSRFSVADMGVATVRAANVRRRQPHTKVQVFGVAEGCFDAPALPVELDDLGCRALLQGGGQTPQVLHLPLLDDNDCSDLELVTRHPRSPK